MGAMFGGVTVVAWYPITPSSSLCESLIDYIKQYRIDDDGKATFAVVQAEDELAAIGMVLGAGWAGRARDDLDLRARHLADGRVRRPRLLRRDSRRDLGHPARRPVDRPADPHRAGRHASGRLPLARRHAAHRADSRRRVDECFEFGDRGPRPGRAVPDAGLRPQRPRPRHEQLDVRSVRVSRASRSIAARCSSAEELDGARQASGAATRRRRRRHPLPHAARHRASVAAYFTRGTGHNEKARYTERPEDYKATVDRLAKKYETREAVRAAAGRRRRAEARRSASSPTARPTWPLEEARASAAREQRRRDELLPPARAAVHRRAARVRRASTSASTSSSRTATARWPT